MLKKKKKKSLRTTGRGGRLRQRLLNLSLQTEFWNQKGGLTGAGLLCEAEQAGARQEPRRATLGLDVLEGTLFPGFEACWETELKSLSTHPFLLHPPALLPHRAG